MNDDKADDLLTLLRSLADGVRGMGLGDPDAGERVEADDVVRWAAAEIERLRRPATWQEEQAAVEAAFERSGVERKWPSDEPDQIIPMVSAMAAEIARLRAWNDEAESRASLLELAIRRLAEQDATLSVCDGSVTVDIDVTLTDAEREAIRLGELAYPGLRITDQGKWVDVWAVLRGLVDRHGGA